MSTKLKLLGVDVASFGDAMGVTPDCLEVVVNDAVNQTYAKLVLSDDAKTLLGGILVGDASSYGILRPMVGEQLPGDPMALIAPAGSDGAGAAIGRRRAARRRADLLVQQRHEGRSHRRHRRRLLRRAGAEEVHAGRHLLRLVRAAAQATARGRGRRAVQGAVRTLQPVTCRAVRDRLRDLDPDLLGTDRALRHRKRLRHMQTRGRVDPCVDELRAHPRRRAGLAAGQQRPLPGQHPEERQLLDRAAGARRRHHARAADPDRRDRQGFRPLHQDHRRPAHRHVRRAGRPAARDLAAAGRRRDGVRATPTARRCAR